MLKTGIRFACAAAALLALSACAASTPYQPARASGYGGYSEQRLDRDRYRVVFSGNSVTSRDQVEMALLLRAAELTLENGFDWFSTVQRATDRDSRYVVRRDPFAYSRHPAYWGSNGRFHRGSYWSPWRPYWDDEVQQYDRYEASAEILMGRGRKPSGDVDAFDAREVVANLSATVTRR